MAVRYARMRAAQITTALVATTAVGVAAGSIIVESIAADLQTQSEIRRFVAAQPDLAIKAVRVEPFGGRLVLTGIESGRDPARHVSIGRLTLARPPIGFGLVTSAQAESALDSALKSLGPNSAGSKPEDPKPEAEPGATPPPAAEGGAAAVGAGAKAAATPDPGAAIPGTATAENVVITQGATTFRIKRIDLTGTALSNAELAHLLDSASGESLEARLRKVGATSIVVPEIVVDDPTAGSAGHAVVSKVTLSGVRAGKATAVAIGGVDFKSQTGEETTSGTVGAIQAFGVDFAQSAHVFDTLRQDDAEPILPIYDSVTVDGIKASNGKGGSFTIASVKETGVKARPLKTDIFAAGKSGQKLSKAENAALFQDLLHSVEVASMDVTDVAGRGTEPADDPATFSLASFAFRGFGKGKIGGFNLRALRFETPTVKLGLGTAAFGPFDIPQGDASQVGSAKTVMASAGKADFDKIDVDIITKDAGKGDQRVKFSIGHSGFSSQGVSGELPVKAKLAFDNIVFDLPADPGQAKPLADMGYHHLDLSLGLSSTYDPDNQELTVRDLTLQGVDMGSLGLGLHLLNVTKGVISQKQEVQKASLLAVLVKELTVDVVNKGLVDRAIAWKAKQDGIGVDAETASLIEFFDKTLPTQFNSANVKIVGAAIAKFVAAPKTLHIGVLSKSGLGAGSMALLSDPVLLIDTLEVNARAD